MRKTIYLCVCAWYEKIVIKSLLEQKIIVLDMLVIILIIMHENFDGIF